MARLDVGLQVDTADYRRAAAGLRVLADRGLNNAVRRGLREVAKPLGQDMVAGGAAKMPHRGGLSARVAGSSVGLRAGIAGSSPSVEILLRQPSGYRLDQMDAGRLRHPVFERGHLAKRKTYKGRRYLNQGPRLERRWVQQAVPAKAFTTPFLEGAPKVRAALVRQVQKAVDEAMGGA